jgi:integrase/recombinase XerC
MGSAKALGISDAKALGMSGAQVLASWLDTLARERRASANTVEAYQADLALFLGFLTRHLGEEPDLAALAALAPTDLRAFLADRARAGDANATRARRLAAVRGFLRHLARRHGGGTAALAGLRAPRAKAPVPRALTPEAAKEVASGIGAVHDPDRALHAGMQAARDVALFTLLYGCGLRISEALSLEVRDAPPPGAQAALRVRGKGDKDRVVPVLPAVRDGDRRLAAPAPRPAAGPAAVRRRARRAAGPGRRAAVAAALPAPGRPARARDAARAAPFLRDAPAGRRRRPARDPGTARPCQPVHHAALHQGRCGRAAGDLAEGASARRLSAARRPVPSMAQDSLAEMVDYRNFSPAPCGGEGAGRMVACLCGVAPRAPWIRDFRRHP